MQYAEKIEKNEERIKKLQEENKILLQKKKAAEKREEEKYLRRVNEIVCQNFPGPPERIDLDFFEYMCDLLCEKMNEVYEQWFEKTAGI